MRLNTRVEAGGDIREVPAYCKAGWKQSPVRASYCFEAVSGQCPAPSTPEEGHFTLVQYCVLDHMLLSFELS